MYHPSITTKSIAEFYDAKGIELHYYPVAESIGRAQEIHNLLPPDKRRDGKGSFPDLSRSLTKEEKAFIVNEVALSRRDAVYWMERYPAIYRDEGMGIGIPQLFESQRIVVRHWGEAQLEQYSLRDRQLPTAGIRGYGHKARQLGFTMLMRMETVRRLTLFTDTRCFAASVDEIKSAKLYERDELILNRLPFFLHPRLPWNVYGTEAGTYSSGKHINFRDLETKIAYHHAKQETGFGQGEQWDVVHCSECASYPYPNILEHDLFPAVSRAPDTLLMLESTAQGRDDWWHINTENARAGLDPEWIYIFIPWYVTSKYRAEPPVDWTPGELAVSHAELVASTSPTYCFGQTVRLTRQQLYFWEKEYNKALQSGVLNIFLTNMCATPEESFQHAGQSAVPFEVLQWMRSTVVPGVHYDFLKGQPGG